MQAGEDVTFIDFWPEHVDHMKQHGLTITHLRDVEPFTDKRVRQALSYASANARRLGFEQRVKLTQGLVQRLLQLRGFRGNPPNALRHLARLGVLAARCGGA